MEALNHEGCVAREGLEAADEVEGDGIQPAHIDLRSSTRAWKLSGRHELAHRETQLVCEGETEC